MTRGIMHSIKFKDKLYRQLKPRPPDSLEHNTLKTNLSNYTKILQKMMRCAKFSYHNDLFSKFKSDIKKTWQHINDLLGRKKCSKAIPDFFLVDNCKVYDKRIIADNFNKFFTEVGPLFSNKIPQPPDLNYKNYMKKNITSKFTFTQVQERDIIKIIGKLKTKSSCGYDELSTKLLKYIRASISTILTTIINQSLFTGIFPEKLKIAKVLPLYKKGDDHMFDNYRPISLLPSISKVIEKNCIYTTI